jgi:hypothetical protein
MNNNKSITRNLLVLIQISILIISLVAFTQMISAQASIAPLPTNVARKTLTQPDEAIQESERNYRAPITGAGWEEEAATVAAQRAAAAYLARDAAASAPGFIGPFGGLQDFGGLIRESIPDLSTIEIGRSITVSMRNLIGSLGVIVLVLGVTYLVIWGLGGQDRAEAWFWSSAAATAVGVGFGTGAIAVGFIGGPIGWVVGGVAALYSFWRRTLRTDQRAVFFDCKPWQAQTGGQYCGECNNREFPCTLYQCKTLGQSCELIDEGDYAKCIYDDRSTTPPEITARIDSLLSDKYRYEPIDATYGVEIQYSDDGSTNWGCLPSYEAFTYGIELDKLGACKMEYSPTRSFEEMTSSVPFGSGRFERNHTQLAFFPGQADLYEEEDGAELPTGEEQVYVRCESTNGHSNVAEFAFRFCIDLEDDINEPVIQGFNFLDRTPIRYFGDELHQTDVTIYVKEPLFADEDGCKWDRDDKSYQEMEHYMNSCDDHVAEFTLFNAQISYTCSDTLTGLLNDQENKFYFRCKDKAGIINTQSKELTLIGSRPLLIDSVGPEGIIKGSSDLVKVTLEARTSAGLEEGKADCSYSETGNYNDYTRFTNTRSYTHSTDIYLEEDTYTYYIQCFDMAGNIVVATTDFEVEADFGPPVVIRAYHSGGNLELITNEPATCKYDSVSCTYLFEEGISMSSSDHITHSVGWDTDNTLYVKCQDEYENHPSGCSITLRPFEFF